MGFDKAGTQAQSKYFIATLSKHVDIVEAMCLHNSGVLGDYEDVCQWIREYHPSEQVQERAIFDKLQREGVLRKNGESWEIPYFLKNFIKSVLGHCTLTTHKVVKAWTDDIQEYVLKLNGILEKRDTEIDFEILSDCLLRLEDVFSSINGSLKENRRTIAAKVDSYSQAENRLSLKGRLEHLEELYDAYVKPILGILTNPLFNNRCAELACVSRDLEDRKRYQYDLAEQAKNLRISINTTQSNAVHETRQSYNELQPLIQKLKSESRIFKGIECFRHLFIDEPEGLIEYIESKFSEPQKLSISLPSNKVIKDTLIERDEITRKPPPIRRTEELKKTPFLSKIMIVKDLQDNDFECLLSFIIGKYPEQKLDVVIRVFFELIKHPIYKKHIDSMDKMKTFQKDGVEFKLKQQRWINDRT